MSSRRWLRTDVPPERRSATPAVDAIQAASQAAHKLGFWATPESLSRAGFWPWFNTLLGVSCIAGIVVTQPMARVTDVAWIAWLGSLLTIGGGATLLARLTRPWRHGSERGVTTRASSHPEDPVSAVSEPELPEAIAVPLKRARNACAGITQLANDPAWAWTRVPVREHEASARAQLRLLEERARRLAMIGGMLASPEGPHEVPGHLQEVADLYQSRCDGLAAAASIFERAQASLACALLAVADGAPGAGAPEAALRDIWAAFDSLSQVLGSLGAEPTPTGSSHWAAALQVGETGSPQQGRAS